MSQAKLDELFLQWLSMPEAQAYVQVRYWASIFFKF
jgi:hypothetical protein